MSRVALACAWLFVTQALWAENQFQDLEDLEPIVPPLEKSEQGEMPSRSEAFSASPEDSKTTSSVDYLRIAPAESPLVLPPKEGVVEPEVAQPTDAVVDPKPDQPEDLAAPVEAEPEPLVDEVTRKIEEQEALDLGLDEKESTLAEELAMPSQTLVASFMFCSLMLVFLWLWFQKQVKGKVKANPRLPMQVVGQTWLDGQTKIVVLRVGAKVLVLAKSAQFCSTLDVITDPEEVNLITLGGDGGGEDFRKVMRDMEDGEQKRQIPDAEGIQSELDTLKKQLGSMRGRTS